MIRIPTQMKADAEMRTYWKSIAGQWTNLGPPLRPCDHDLAVMRSVMLQRPRGRMRVLMFGVTPEIAELDWPRGTQLEAIEQSAEMINAVWPGDIRGVRRAHLGDWTQLPFEKHSFDVGIGDGCYTCMEFPRGYEQLTRSIHGALKPDGTLVIRCFVSPDISEHPDEIILDLLAGRIGSFHAFKWRLAMAVQDEPRHGVCLHDVWRTWSIYRIDQNELAQRLGWTLEAIQTIELYRDNLARYSFPGREQAISEIHTLFDVKHIHIPTYELGERCPILFLNPRAG